MEKRHPNLKSFEKLAAANLLSNSVIQIENY